MRIRTVVMMIAAAAILTVARPAFAQEKGAANFAIGYSNITFLDDTANNNVPKGWLASIGVGVNSMAAFVGEVGGHYQDGGKFHTFQGGLRFSSKKNPKATPFFQIVTGLGHQTGSNAWTLTPGGGFDAKINDKCAARIQADWMVARQDGANNNAFRVSGGIVINIPKK